MKTSLSGLVLALALSACGTRESGVRTEAERQPSVRAASEKPRASQPAAAAASDETPSFEWSGPRSEDWLSWRGPHQNGTSDEPSPPTSIDPAKPLWTAPISGRGTPVIADGLVYALGYQGEGATCVEMLVCLDERTGEIL